MHGQLIITVFVLNKQIGTYRKDSVVSLLQASTFFFFLLVVILQIPTAWLINHACITCCTCMMYTFTVQNYHNDVYSTYCFYVHLSQLQKTLQLHCSCVNLCCRAWAACKTNFCQCHLQCVHYEDNDIHTMRPSLFYVFFSMHGFCRPLRSYQFLINVALQYVKILLIQYMFT